MKALTVRQPWATLIALGLKRYETRSWDTRHRGPLAVHASRRIPDPALMERAEQLAADRLDLTVAWPLGAIVATVWLVGTQDTLDTIDSLSAHRPELVALEAAFGDWTPGRYAWELADPAPVHPPVPVRGHQGLWEWQ